MFSFEEVQQMHDAQCRARGIDTYGELKTKLAAVELASSFGDDAEGWNFLKRYLAGDETAKLQVAAYQDRALPADSLHRSNPV
ncbi:hypothetical protein KTD31_01920 [Burkholderia multivorans]|jgi:hypothetical protein|uniref:hypothetical protein n=1 Tax=Burkholderia multivorans TaxID=87883 RepID=UPI001C224AB8|nr:hypothetical protein [Burkholderia multivorans]MBU9200161.1 hypothetical protein [Burkholderia multivorans]MDN8078717.1 hypothetical protein [Burkholderia multivorans]